MGANGSSSSSRSPSQSDDGIIVAGQPQFTERTSEARKKFRASVHKITMTNSFLSTRSAADLAERFAVKEQNNDGLQGSSSSSSVPTPKIPVSEYRSKINQSNFFELDALRQALRVSDYDQSELEQLDSLFLNRALRLSEAAEKRRKEEQRIQEEKEMLAVEAASRKAQEEYDNANRTVAINHILDSNSFTYDNLYDYRFRTLSKNTQKDLDSHFELRSDKILASTIPLAHFSTFQFHHESLDNIYLVYGREANGTIHSISLAAFNEKILRNNTPDDPTFNHELSRQVTLKMHSLGITDYAYATQEQVDQLKPPRYMAFGNSLLGSTVAVGIFNSTAYTAFLGPILGFSLFWLNAHSNLKTLNYQNKKENKGSQPNDDIKDVFNHDARTLCYQNLFATTVSSLILSTPTHEAFKCAVGIAWVLALPAWAHATISLGIGLVMGSALVGIAMYRQRNEDKYSKNRYTAKQLGFIFAAGFAAGALIYPALMLSTIAPTIVSKNAAMAVLANTANFAMLFQVIINFGLGIALHKNIGDRLEAPKKEGKGVLSYRWNANNEKTSADIPSLLPRTPLLSNN